MPPQQVNPSLPTQQQEIATPTSFWKRKFEEKCGYAFSATYFLFIVAVVVAGYTGQDRLLGLDFENFIVYTAPDIAYIPWLFYSGVNILAVGMTVLVISFFFFSRYLIGYLWGKIFVLLSNRYLQALYVVGTIVALIFYANFVLYNATSIEQISQSANTVEDCAKYKDSASGYMPICIKEVALKNNNPDLCLKLEEMGWDGFTYNCLQDYASAKNDSTVCAKMGDRGNGKDTCYGYFKQCEKMSPGTGKDSCFIMRASDTRDKSVCQFVQNSTRAEECACVSQYGYYGSQCSQARAKVIY